MPRPTPLLDLRDAIKTAWEALTPPDYDRRKYKHVDKPGSGASSHRTFYFRLPRGGEILEQGKSTFTLNWDFDAVVKLHLPERTSVEFDAFYQEAQVLLSAIHTIAIPTGIQVPIAVRCDPEAPLGGKAGDLNLTIAIRARAKEQTT